ncbi:Tyrosine recombinase XerC [Mannheimia haemolytica]|uniref:Tyrosine recombinase XerC n=1 Tax=Mannheimia haemolytica TaxID=75985 RepID=A0A378MR64_MANHA|nr:Tyrosine recombinase XerC [Mannheimia haemolytica]
MEKLRRIYIPKSLQKECSEWLRLNNKHNGFIFLNKYGDRITTRGIASQLKVFARRYKLDPKIVYPHSFRHRFAKSFLERFNDIAFLADLMGHESIETTRSIYEKQAQNSRKL